MRPFIRPTTFLAGLAALAALVMSGTAAAATITVKANVYATDTGITLQEGQSAIITATGAWEICGGVCPGTPDGSNPRFGGWNNGVGGLPAGLLISSLDGGYTWSAVGSGPTVVRGSGQLLLGPNDGGDYGDNYGFLTVEINVINDADADGVADEIDNCRVVSNADQADADADGAGNACDTDSDNDGVSDDSDSCPGTAAGAIVEETSGCSLEQLCPCDASWKNHGQYVSCVSQTADALTSQGSLTKKQKGEFTSAAARSSCGK